MVQCTSHSRQLEATKRSDSHFRFVSPLLSYCRTILRPLIPGPRDSIGLTTILKTKHTSVFGCLIRRLTVGDSNDRRVEANGSELDSEGLVELAIPMARTRDQSDS